MTTPQVHSPFHVVEGFFAPTQCEQIIKELGLSVPTWEIDGETPIPYQKMLGDTKFDALVKARLNEVADDIEARYGATITGIDKPTFYQFFENPKIPAVPHGCESMVYKRKAWVKVKDVDLVGFIWLKDFNAGVPLDPRFETYGGKLEFPVHNFSILPKRGDCVIYPAGPHFISAVSHVLVGRAEYIKFALKLQVEIPVDEPEPGNKETTRLVDWHYQPANFPGNYQQWFA